MELTLLETFTSILKVKGLNSKHIFSVPGKPWTNQIERVWGTLKKTHNTIFKRANSEREGNKSERSISSVSIKSCRVKKRLSISYVDDHLVLFRIIGSSGVDRRNFPAYLMVLSLIINLCTNSSSDSYCSRYRLTARLNRWLMVRLINRRGFC